MRIRVSKTFASFISKTAKEMGFEAKATVVKCPADRYEFWTGEDIFDAMDYGDFVWEDNEVKALQVVYPSEYYACAKIITTKRLNQEYIRRGCSTLDDLKEMIRDLFEV